MELFGIALSVPGAVLAGAVYRRLLLLAGARWPRVKPVFMFVSCLVLAAMITEWIFLAARGSSEPESLSDRFTTLPISSFSSWELRLF